MVKKIFFSIMLGMSSLVFSYELNSIDKAQILVWQNRGFTSPQQLLNQAARSGNLSIAKYFVKEEEVDVSRGVYILNAIRGESIAIVKLLLDNGADIDTVDQDRRGALFYAVWSKSLEMLKFIIDKGDFDNMNIKSKLGQTPIFDSFYSSSENTKYIMQHLISKGAKLDIIDNNGQSLLSEALMKANLKELQVLIDAGIDFKITNNKNYSAIEQAMFLANERTLERLLNKIAKIFINNGGLITENCMKIAKDIDSMPAMIFCSSNGGGDLDVNGMIKKFIDNGNIGKLRELLKVAKVGKLTKLSQDRTPLMTAAYKGDLHMIETLLPHSNVEQTNSQNQTALYFAIVSTNYKAVRSLIAAGAKPTQALLDLAISTREKTPNGYTAEVFYTIEEAITGKRSIRQRLQKKQPEISIFDAINTGNTFKVKNVLKKQNIDFLKQQNGQSALWFAYNQAKSSDKKRKFDILKLLVKAGADVNEKDSSGETLLIKAVKSQDYSLVKYLRHKKVKANIYIKDSKGKTAVNYAYNIKNKKLRKKILKKLK